MSAPPGLLRRLWSRLRGSPVDHDLARYRRLVEAVGALEEPLRGLSDASLSAGAAALRLRRQDGASSESLRVEAFATAREVARRTVGLRPYDVQVIAAAALHEGRVLEAATGEGKTLAAVLPVFLHALAGQGVHVLTFNDYLAGRDAAWMGPAYAALGLSVGVVLQASSPAERREAYACDVTYLTAREAGFDLLRDQRCLSAADQVQRPLYAALVDEADSLLIDEARVPLVIAGSSLDLPVEPGRALAAVRQLRLERDIDADLVQRAVSLTEQGYERVERLLGCGHLQAPEQRDLLVAIHLALQAEVLLRRDVDYIVRDERVQLVDEFTGRVVEHRRWPDGLQAALEVKEGLHPQREGLVLGSIALQHFLPLYERVCGMTATARAAATELRETYGLDTLAVPPHRPCVREDHEDRVFTHKEAKEAAVEAEVAAVHATGRPVLVGTVSVHESEHLADRLRRLDVPHRVLNARNDAQEAEIIAEAGRPGAVTLSTNMAGRGTDIRLGGSRELDRERVVALGGLYVIGTNRHASRRVDEQLRGRAGRQGDPGCSRFFVCLEDPLFERVDPADVLRRRTVPARQQDPLTRPAVVRAVQQAQRIVEGQEEGLRSTLRTFTSVVERRRRVLSRERQRVLEGEDLAPLLQEHAPQRFAELRDLLGDTLLAQAERRVHLLHLDALWADHLAFVADVREGMQISGMAASSPFFVSDDPLKVFHERVVATFDGALDALPAEVVASLVSASLSDARAALANAGPAHPGSTWTYIQEESPWDRSLQGFFRGLKRRFSGG